MAKGPRKRRSSSGGSHLEPPDSHLDGGNNAGGTSGVALKKQIGLVSACGIIVGKSILHSTWCFLQLKSTAVWKAHWVVKHYWLKSPAYQIFIYILSLFRSTAERSHSSTILMRVACALSLSVCFSGNFGCHKISPVPAHLPHMHRKVNKK